MKDQILEFEYFFYLADDEGIPMPTTANDDKNRIGSHMARLVPVKTNIDVIIDADLLFIFTIVSCLSKYFCEDRTF